MQSRYSLSGFSRRNFIGLSDDDEDEDDVEDDARRATRARSLTPRDDDDDIIIKFQPRASHTDGSGLNF
jgi:hypothetical protein